MPQARPSTATSVDQASNPYATLGITRTASLDEIRAAWKRAALKTHPDRTFDDGSAFRAVQAAYEKLMSSVSSASSVSRWAAPRPAEPADKWTAHQRAERQHATVERQRSERQRQERERAEAARAASKLAEERARYSAHKTYAERARAFAAEEQMRREAHKAARGKTWARGQSTPAASSHTPRRGGMARKRGGAPMHDTRTHTHGHTWTARTGRTTHSTHDRNRRRRVGTNGVGTYL
jgi:curved DNA-binding protein CbpA